MAEIEAQVAVQHVGRGFAAPGSLYCHWGVDPTITVPGAPKRLEKDWKGIFVVAW